MNDSNSQQLSLSERILLGVIILVSAHLALSWSGLVPSEVSAFNQKVVQAVQKLHTVKYMRKPSKQLSGFDPKVSTTTPMLPTVSEDSTSVGVEPTHIKIPKIGINNQITNPTSTTVKKLDNALRQGVVHYPGSGRIGGNKPMFLFGHSSRLPVVQNEAYKAFNGLNKLSAGDKIIVSGNGKVANYEVTTVRVVDKDKAYVDFTEDNNTLKISTCTTFGAKENRVVVTARQL